MVPTDPLLHVADMLRSLSSRGVCEVTPLDPSIRRLCACKPAAGGGRRSLLSAAGGDQDEPMPGSSAAPGLPGAGSDNDAVTPARGAAAAAPAPGALARVLLGAAMSTVLTRHGLSGLAAVMVFGSAVLPQPAVAHNWCAALVPP